MAFCQFIEVRREIQRLKILGNLRIVISFTNLVITAKSIETKAVQNWPKTRPGAKQKISFGQ